MRFSAWRFELVGGLSKYCSNGGLKYIYRP